MRGSVSPERSIRSMSGAVWLLVTIDLSAYYLTTRDLHALGHLNAE